MTTRRPLHPAELACMPLAHAIVEAQTTIARMQAALMRAQPQQIMAITKQSEAARKATDDADAHADEEDAMDDEGEPIAAQASTKSRSASLPVPAALSPEIPAALLALHGQLASLHSLLQSFPALQRTACFDAVFAGPLFTVMVSHPKAVERAQAAAAGAGAGSTDSSGALRSPAFPMLPHQDRVWESMLSCVESLLQSGIQAPVAFVGGSSFPKRFFLLFQQLLHFIPSDFKTASSAPGSSAAASSATSASIAVWHSEETRLQALQCVNDLFLCVEQAFDLSLVSSSVSSAVAAQIAPLLSTFQRDASFCVSLGYCIHLLLRFATKERNRMIRSRSIEALSTIMRLLQHEVINQSRDAAAAAASAAGPATASVPGRMLLLSYFPGVMSALFNLLIFDSGRATRSGGWRLQLQSFQLFVSVTQAAVRQVAKVDEIVREATDAAAAQRRAQQQQQQLKDENMIALDAHTRAAEAAVAKLQALVPKSAAAAAPSASPSAPSFNPAHLHPMLQQILKPVDAAWWAEARANIAAIMARVFASSQLMGRAQIAREMLKAAESFLVPNPEESEASDPRLTAAGHTIYTSLLPRECVVTWLEFIVQCNEHEEEELREMAHQIVEKIGSSHAAAAWKETAVIPASAPAASNGLVPLLSASLSNHLLRLPRVLPSATEAGQVSLLKTIKGCIDVLGRSAGSASASLAWSSSSNPVYAFLAADQERIWKILYAAFAMSTHESKVLERNVETSSSALVAAASSSTGGEESKSVVPASTSLVDAAPVLPTYYSFSFTHLHTASAQSLSLSLLRSVGFHTASHFGLLIAYLHDRLLCGIESVRRGDYSSSNQLKETVLFINQIVLGLGDALRPNAAVSIAEVFPHVELMLLEYLNPLLWHLPITSARAALSQTDLHNNALIVSLLLRGLGDMAEAMQVEFRPWLMHILYPMLEKLGSNASVVVRQAALVSLHRIADECGYAFEAAEALAPGLTPTPDQVLQSMLVSNMDYLVEQMSVELRSLNLGRASLDPAGATLTLPLVLSSLLTRISLACTQALIPLLDDILLVVLDKLGEISLHSDIDDGSSDATLGRLAYLEILRSVVRAIELIQEEEAAKAAAKGVQQKALPSIYTSTAPIPALPAAAAPTNAPLLAAPTPSAPSTAVAEFNPDSLLNLDSDMIQQESPPDELKQSSSSPISPSALMTDVPSAAAASPTVATAPAAPDAAASLPYFSAAAIRQRLQASFRAKHDAEAADRIESEWLNSSTSASAPSRGVTIEEEKGDGAAAASLSDDVPRDASGKTKAERWYEQNELRRVREAEKKFNSINGVPDEGAEADMQKEAEAHEAAEEKDVPLTPDQSTALRIFTQCRNLLLTASGSPSAVLSQKLLVLDIVAHAIPVLSRVPKQFFPEIAKFWPSLQIGLRLMENSQATTVSSTKLLGGSATNEGTGFVNSLVADAASSPSSALESLTSVRSMAERSAASQSETQLTALIASITSAAAASSAATLDGSVSFTHSTASPLFIHSLHILSLLSSYASKFLSSRFSKEVWPTLQEIMQFEQGWMDEMRAATKLTRSKHLQQRSPNNKRAASGTDAAEDSALSLLPAYKVQHALLRALSNLVRFPDLSSLHVVSIATHVSPYLSVDQPATFRQLAEEIMRSLMQIDVDAVWAQLWILCPSVATRDLRIDATPAVSSEGSFLSHPCFHQIYPNFDARFLLHQRMQPMQASSAPGSVGSEYASSVSRLMDAIALVQAHDPKILI